MLPAPVVKLITYGDPRPSAKHWPDYASLGITTEHVPALIEVVQGWPTLWGPVDQDDDDDNETDDVFVSTQSASAASIPPRTPLQEQLRSLADQHPHAWAGFIHAWRALGQLQAVDAVRPLLDELEGLRAAGTDWSDEFMELLPLFGEGAFADVEREITRDSISASAGDIVGSALVRFGKKFPPLRDRCVAALVKALSKFETNVANHNAYLICNLIDLKAVESASLIRDVYRSGRIDQFTVGGWGSVRKDLGLERLPDDPPDEQDVTWTPPILRAVSAMSDQIFANSAQRPALPVPSSGISEYDRRRAEKQKQKARQQRKVAKKTKRQNRRK